jgi:hypothetical protein
VGVPPVRHAPARLGPSSPVTAAQPPASEQNFAPVGFVATPGTDTHPQSLRRPGSFQPHARRPADSAARAARFPGLRGSYAECPDRSGRRSTCGRTDRRFMRGLRCRTLILVASIQATEGLAVCGLTRSGFRPVGLWAYRIGQFSILLMVIFSDSRQSRCLVAPSSRFPPSTRNGRHRSRHSAHNYE